MADFAKIGMNPELVNPYWELATADPEVKLNKKVLYIGITEKKCKQLTKWFVELPNCKRRHPVGAGATDDRNHDIHIVLGPSGSGKTTHLLKRRWATDENQRSFTLFFPLASKFNSKKSLIDYLVTNIQPELEKYLGDSYRHEKPFKMQMVLIIDEVNNFREGIGSLQDLIQFQKLVSDVFAEKVMLVIAGTGYDTVASGLDSRNDVYKYYMKPWSADDVIEVARKRYENDDAAVFADDVRRSLQKHPVLANLATNARAASIMIGDVPRYYYEAIANEQYRHYVVSILSFVAARYIGSNGLGKLSGMKRRKVAQAVLIELKKTWENKNMHETRAPSFHSIPYQPKSRLHGVSSTRTTNRRMEF